MKSEKETSKEKSDVFVQNLDIANLQVGMEVKNYKELCGLLGDPIKKGNSKLSQLADWQRYFTFTKQGHKYIIDEIYPIPKQKKDNSLYVRFIEYILANELATRKNNVESNYAVNYTKTNLFYVLGMANKNYLKDNRKSIEDDISYIPRWQIHDFYRRSDKQLSKILFDSLNSMKHRSLLDYKRVQIIVEDKKHRIATEQEESIILAAGNEILCEMGLSKKPFWNLDLTNRFYRKLNNKLSEEYGWSSVYSEIRIVYTREQIIKNLNLIKKELVESLLDKTELLRAKASLLNDNIISSINRLTEKCFEKNIEEYNREVLELNQPLIDEGWASVEKPFYKPNTFRYPDDFLDNQKKLSELFLRIYQLQENDEN